MTETDKTAPEEPKPVTYKLTLEGGGVTVERDVDEAVALQIMASIMGGNLQRLSTSRMAAPLAEKARSEPGGGSGGLSVREHMEEFEPKRNVDKILALAAYVTDVRGQETFTADDVKKAFRSAREPVPGNYARDFRWAVANAWLAEAEDPPGEYYVTSRGRDALSARFSDEVKRSTGVERTARRRRARKKGEEK